MGDTNGSPNGQFFFSRRCIEIIRKIKQLASHNVEARVCECVNENSSRILCSDMSPSFFMFIFLFLLSACESNIHTQTHTLTHID